MNPSRAQKRAALLLTLSALCCQSGEGPTREREAPASSRPPRVEAAPNLVLFTVDTLRPDHLSLYSYERDTTPNIDRFFAGGAIYTNAFSTQANTTPSIVSMLTGLLPQEHGTRILFQLLPENLQLLSDRLPENYETAAFVSNFVLTEEATGLASHFDHYDDFVDERVPRSDLIYERRADATIDAVLGWLSRRDRSRPLFLWVHLIDPHGPYDPPQEWRDTFSHPDPLPISPDRVPGHMEQHALLDGLEYIDRYDEEIRFLDHHSARLLDSLSDFMPLDETVVVFAADHGETMMEQERWFAHGYHVYDAIVRIPLMVRGPGFDGAGLVEQPVSVTDIAATFSEIVGIDREEMTAVPLGERTASDVLFAEATRAGEQWRVAVRGSERWMVRLTDEGVEKIFFDLDQDPLQESPLPWPLPGVDDSPGQKLLRLVESDPDPRGWPVSPQEGQRLDAPKVHPRADEEALKKLRALGYVGS